MYTCTPIFLKITAKLKAIFNSTEYHPCVHLINCLKLIDMWLDYGADAILDSKDSGIMYIHGQEMKKYHGLQELLAQNTLSYYHSTIVSMGKYNFDSQLKNLKLAVLSYTTNEDGSMSIYQDLLNLCIFSKPVQHHNNLRGIRPHVWVPG